MPLLRQVGDLPPYLECVWILHRHPASVPALSDQQIDPAPLRGHFLSVYRGLQIPTSDR